MKTEYYLLKNYDGLELAVLSCNDMNGLEKKVEKVFEELYSYVEGVLIVEEIYWNDDDDGESTLRYVGNDEQDSWDETFTLIPIDLY